MSSHLGETELWSLHPLIGAPNPPQGLHLPLPPKPIISKKSHSHEFGGAHKHSVYSNIYEMKIKLEKVFFFFFFLLAFSAHKAEQLMPS